MVGEPIELFGLRYGDGMKLGGDLPNHPREIFGEFCAEFFGGGLGFCAMAIEFAAQDILDGIG